MLAELLMSSSSVPPELSALALSEAGGPGEGDVDGLAGRLGVKHLDTDNYFWEATDPPFTTKRPEAERVALMEAEVAGEPSWVISGSLIGWATCSSRASTWWSFCTCRTRCGWRG